MRYAPLRESLKAAVAVALMGALCFDEEPLLELSDWNVLHVGLLAIGALSVLSEQVLRARYGQFVTRDLATALAAFTFWQQLENYIRALLLVLALHALSPIEGTLIELVEVYSAASTWVACTFLPPCLWLLGALYLATLTNSALSSGRQATLWAGCLGVCVCLLSGTLLLSWHCVTAGPGVSGTWGSAEVFYLQAQTALTYDGGLGAVDPFEWHRASAAPFVLHFEHLYAFLLTLLLLWALSAALLVWLYVLNDAVRGHSRGLGYTHVSVGVLWLEHTAWAFMATYLLLALQGCRLLARSPIDLFSA